MIMTFETWWNCASSARFNKAREFSLRQVAREAWVASRLTLGGHNAASARKEQYKIIPEVYREEGRAQVRWWVVHLRRHQNPVYDYPWESFPTEEAAQSWLEDNKDRK
jgi:hypothetical protein